MKKHSGLGIPVLLFTLLSGCSQTTISSGSVETPVALNASPTSIITLSAQDATATPENRTIYVDGGPAPSYEEIKEAFERLPGTALPSEGSDNSALDPQLDEALYAYSESLVGMTAVDWQGWYYGYIEGDTPERSTISLLMEEPKSGVDYPTQVLIISPSPDLVDKIGSWKIGQPVLINGILAGIDADGTVAISNATLEPRE